MKRRVLAGMVVAVTASATLTACSSSGGAKQGGRDGRVTVVITADPGNLDPQATATSAAGQLVAFAYDTLVHVKPDGTVVSGLATAWKQDKNTYTFTMGKDATCADGSPVTPKLVADNLSYVANPKSQSPLLGLYMPSGAKVTATADSVVLTTTTPFPFLMNGIAQVPIVCKKGMANRKSLARGTSGSGPFVLKESVPDDHYTYTVRKGYKWGPSGAGTATKGTPGTVVFKVVPNESTAANLLLSGAVNIATVFGPDRARVEAQKLNHEDLGNVAGEFYFNEAKGRPTADVGVRRALVAALDLPELGAALTNGHGVESTGMVTLEPTACKGNTVKGNLPEPGLASARNYLRSAGWVESGGGWTKGGKPLQITFLYGTEKEAVTGAELTVAQWKKLGVKVTTASKPSSELNSVLFKTGGWDVTSNTLQVQFPSQLVPFLSGPEPAAGTNFAHLHNAEYERLATSAAAKEGSTGCPEWLDAERALIRQADVIPYSNVTIPVWGRGVEFVDLANGIDPTTLRFTSA